MPFVLMVLFVIALSITCVGFFLSSRGQASRPANDYLLTSKGRRIVESTTVPERAHRQDARASGVSVVRSRANGSSTSRAPITVNRIQLELGRTRADVSNASAINPGFWEPFIGRAGSWKILVPGLVAIFLLGSYLVSITLPHEVSWTSPWFGQTSAQSTPQAKTHPLHYTASQDLNRVYQLDPAQYRSSQDYNTWAYSACSAAAMTEVINSYGHHYRIADILKIEAQIGEITPQDGLLEEVGIQRTGTKFGFKTTWGDNRLNLNQLIAAANSGTPVIISFPPSTFAGGHILVVRGGNSTYVYLADSSRLDWTRLTHTRFMQLWRGFSAIMTPA